MAKISQKYEAVAVFSTKLEKEAITELIDKFKKLIEENAALTEVDEWGVRKLAYPINYEEDGYYVLFSFESKPEFPKELDRIFNITDHILRTLIVAKEA